MCAPLQNFNRIARNLSVCTKIALKMQEMFSVYRVLRLALTVEP
jgi:hypothetical protein